MNTTAKAKVTIEISPIGGVWSDKCSVAQIQEQAVSAARDEIVHMIKSFANMKLVGTPTVTVVMVTDDDD